MQSSTFKPGNPAIGSIWRGQLFLFDKPQAPSYSSLAGYKLLAVVFIVEFLLRPLFRMGGERLGIAARPWWMLLEMSLLTGLAFWLVIGFARVQLSQLGLCSWRHWSPTEKFFLPQIVFITLAVFSFFSWRDLRALWIRQDMWQICLFVCVPHLIWGFYQELLYRGALQTELVRRWGAPTGVLASNLIFTFGPLHAYHFSAVRVHPTHLWIFAAIFGIGMYFAILFQRSGNLWIVGLLHGLGDWFIDGLAVVARMAK